MTVNARYIESNHSLEILFKLFITLLILIVSSNLQAEGSDVRGDLALPVDNLDIVQQGSLLYSEKCSACHGGEGRGGRAPCVTCGKFTRSGNTNSGIYATIAAGIPMTKMGAFGASMSGSDILSLVTYLRWQETQRVKNGEIRTTEMADQEPLKFPNTENAYNVE